MASTAHSQFERPVFIIDGSRSPFLKFRNRPGPFKAAELAVQTARPLLLRQPFEADALDEVILGCAAPGAEEMNIARVAALRAGCGNAVPAWTVQRNCGSGLQAFDSAFRNIASGRADLILAGGVEAMSHAPLLLQDKLVEWLAAWRAAGTRQRLKLISTLRPSNLAPVSGLLKGLSDPGTGLSMGQTAENLAYRFGISREEMDHYACESHRRLYRAQETPGVLREIEVIYDRKGNACERDDGVRPDTTIDKLAALKPAFDKPFGKVTVGNSAQLSDGAAWLILASEAAVNRHGLNPPARVVDCEWAGLDPAQMGLGPVHAMAPVLARNALETTHIDYWEINEAFAAQVLACLAAAADLAYSQQELGLDRALGEIPHERLNVDGGAIGLGHPEGASGARLVLHLMHVLQREKASRGVAALCIGGGQGGAMLIENLHVRP
ncbi:MAG: acetyl-CoA C-acetyltransferase [Gammaproteobacteria bacterium]|nr:acetyl-CoA C-acetyltransferase [Gammaproteobacteria bacterium]